MRQIYYIDWLSMRHLYSIYWTLCVSNRTFPKGYLFIHTWLDQGDHKCEEENKNKRLSQMSRLVVNQNQQLLKKQAHRRKPGNVRQAGT